MKISIAIPTYEMNGEGAKLLKRSLDAIEKQTFKDFEVVISDNSLNDEIKTLCSYYSFPINYFKSDKVGMAPNTNEAMRACKGEIIKILYMDDYLNGADALENIVEAFLPEINWLVTGCIHLENEHLVRPHYPSYNHEIYKGINTIGSPTVLSLRNKDLIFFDEKMTWLLDCDYYARMYDKHGEPEFLYDTNVVMGLGKHQVTNMLAESIKQNELEYMLDKYATL